MNKDLLKSVSIFERTNELKIENYYSINRPKSKFATIDNYIGGDVFLKRIEEWLEICTNSEERFYLLRLLEEYLYFPRDRFERDISSIVCHLEEKNINLNEALFVVFPSKKGIVSGGDSVSSALIVATMDKITKDHIVTDAALLTDDLLKKIECYKFIVFLDDVVGSGKTIYSNVTDFLKRVKVGENVTVYLAAICGREKVIKRKARELSKLCNDPIEFKYILLHPLQKCLDEYLGEDRIKRSDLIKTIERKIGDFAIEDKDKDFFLGFERNQLLVSFYYNTPNNTLSLFWRPSEISVPLFKRTSYKRMSIEECRKNKIKLENNAYKRGKIQGGINDSNIDSLIY